MHLPFTRLLTAVTAALVVLAATIAGGLPGTLEAADAAAVDDYARYDAQTTCASAVLPGTAFLLRHLVRTHPGTRAVSTLRSCTGDSTSEHKDGRALDWGVDAADARERAVAYAWLERIFAADRSGNPDALARRMGIMYVIWDDHIYSAYNGFEKRAYTPCDPVRACSKTARHRDHVHVSLSRAGAAAQTTFYRARGVPSVPVLIPGTKQLDPVSTAVVTLPVPASGTTVTSAFKLTRGATYRVVADGLVRTGPGARVADAACRWTATGWTPSSVLTVDGRPLWGETCSDGHTYETWFTAARTDYLRLRVDGSTATTSEGALTFSILREDLAAGTVAARRVTGSPEPRPARSAGPPARGLVTEGLTVRAAAKGGALTERALRLRGRYRVVVSGTASSGGTVFDGQCVRYAGRLRSQHTLDLTQPAADHLAVYVQGVKVALRVPGSTAACSGAHTYVGVVRPVVPGRARVKVWDPYSYGDNSGALKVTLRRL